MDLSTSLVAAVLLASFTAIQVWINKGRFDSLDRRIDGVEKTLTARIDRHEQNNERRFEQIVQEIAQLRSDLLQVVLRFTPTQETG